MAAHLLQVAYYPALLNTRSEMLKNAGYRVTSVLGNEEAMALPASVIAAAAEYVPVQRIIPCTNCGMAPMPRDIAAGKLAALARGAALARRKFG